MRTRKQVGGEAGKSASVKLTLIQDDCLKAMKDLPDESVDLVVTDPPYFVGFSSQSKEHERRDWANITVLAPLFERLFKTFNRILKSNGKVFMFTDWRTYPILYISASKFMKVSNCIVWDYGWIKAGKDFRFTHEFILYATMPRAKSPKDRGVSDVWRIKPINFTTQRFCSTEKPVEIIKKMLKETSNEGDLILDCFLGSGTTMKACLETKRNCIGMEINPKYIDICKKRVNWGSSLGNVEFEFKEAKK